jgi:hypothetical protein
MGEYSTFAYGLSLNILLFSFKLALNLIETLASNETGVS